jgi:chromosome partitioning protein
LSDKYLLWKKDENLKILPANTNLRTLEPELVAQVDGRVRLKARLQLIQDEFDYIIIDTPPTAGIFTQGPLIASHYVIAPIDVGFFSLEGIRQLLADITKIRAHYNPELEIRGVLLTKYDSRTVLSKQVEKTLRNNFGKQVFDTVIRVNVDLIRSQIQRENIFEFDPECSGAKDYQNLMNELVGNVVALPQRRAVSAKVKAKSR